MNNQLTNKLQSNAQKNFKNNSQNNAERSAQSNIKANFQAMIKQVSKTRAITFAALTLTLLSSHVSYAVEPQEIEADKTHFTMMTQQGQHNKMRYMMKKLQLDTKQQSDIKAIRKAAKEQNRTLFESLKYYRSELALLSRADFFDEQAITDLHSAFQINLAQATLIKAKTRHAILQVLSEQQKSEWFALIEKRQERKMAKRY
jgi:Spy/CpxP family protein refolding chaperone